MPEQNNLLNQAAFFPGGATVLMAVYAKDNTELFKSAVESVFENTLQPDAFILVVDGVISNELNVAVAELEQKFSLTVLRLPKNQGLANALNKGLALVETQWVLRADADDYNLPNRFELQAKEILKSNNEIDMIGGAIQEVSESGAFLGIRKPPCSNGAILKYALSRNPFNHMTVAFKKELVAKVGGYPAVYLKEDYALWSKVLSVPVNVINLPDILVKATADKEFYRRRGGLKYALAEYSLQKYLYRNDMKSLSDACCQGIQRAMVFLFPSFLRERIYKKYLRD